MTGSSVFYKDLEVAKTHLDKQRKWLPEAQPHVKQMHIIEANNLPNYKDRPNGEYIFVADWWVKDNELPKDKILYTMEVYPDAATN